MVLNGSETALGDKDKRKGKLLSAFLRAICVKALHPLRLAFSSNCANKRLLFLFVLFAIAVPQRQADGTFEVCSLQQNLVAMQNYVRTGNVVPPPYSPGILMRSTWDPQVSLPT